jgi:hypothetical protein
VSHAVPLQPIRRPSQGQAAAARRRTQHRRLIEADERREQARLDRDEARREVPWAPGGQHDD